MLINICCYLDARHCLIVGLSVSDIERFSIILLFFIFYSFC